MVPRLNSLEEHLRQDIQLEEVIWSFFFADYGSSSLEVDLNNAFIIILDYWYSKLNSLHNSQVVIEDEEFDFHLQSKMSLFIMMGFPLISFKQVTVWI